MNMYSNHPYEPYIVDDATKIIIGSMPPYRFCIENGKIYDDDVNFFYGSNRNNFWKLVGEVTNTNFLFSKVVRIQKIFKVLIFNIMVCIVSKYRLMSKASDESC